MHAVLYVCLPRSEASNSAQAREKVCEYLSEQGFALELWFAGRCDYFSVGGRWSGLLNLLRLRHEQPKKFDQFWKRYRKTSTAKAAKLLFRKTFPKYRGMLPIYRNRVSFEGQPDDAQIMDEPLFQQLKPGFSAEVSYAYEINEPNVIFTDRLVDDDDLPNSAEEASKFWVVLIDYHH